MTRADEIQSIARAPWVFGSADITAAMVDLSRNPLRQKLPERRRNETVNSEWTAPDESVHTFAISVGVDVSGRVLEVFANHAKGSLAAILADICVVISIALQYGIPPEALAKSLGCINAWPEGIAPASPVGTIIATICAAEVPPMPPVAVGLDPPLGPPEMHDAEVEL